MNKFFNILSISVLFFLSCSNPTPEEQAKKLMEQYAKNKLVKPDSYEFIDMKLDSCFYGSQVSPETFQFVLELGYLYNDYKRFKTKADGAETSLAIYSSSSFGYDSAFEKQKRKQYKEEFDKASKMKENYKEKILQLYKDNIDLLKAYANGGGEFTGYFGILQYRAETNGGTKRIGEDLFFFDKKITNVLSTYDGDDLRDLMILEDINYEFESDLAELFS